MATINDIARMANVSTTTVSHVVNKTRYVSPELVERVEKAIREAGDVPNFIAKKTALSSDSFETQYIVVLVTNKESNFQKQVVKEFGFLASVSKYTLITLICDDDINAQQDFYRVIFKSKTVAGVIVFPDKGNNVFSNILAAEKIPTVVIGEKPDNYLADCIISDTQDGAMLATQHLIRRGHEHIAFIASNLSNYNRRLAGYTKALEQYHLKVDNKLIFTDIDSEESVYRILKQMLEAEVPPSAVFVANYSIIIPMLRYLDMHNIKCPEDLSIVCFNDFECAPLINPSITTIRQNVEEIGKLAFSTLANRIAKKEPANLPALKNTYTMVHVPTRIVVRDSTCGIGRGPYGERAASSSLLNLTEKEKEEIRAKKFTAAISFHYAGKSWMMLTQKGILEIFNQLGISIIATTDAHFNPSLQCRQLASLNMLEPDILISIPTDNSLTSEAYLKFRGSKTKLIFISNIPDGLSPADYVTCVSVNERSHGRNMGEGLGEYLVRHKLSNYAMVVHEANFYATNQRDSSAEQVLTEEYPSLTSCGVIKFQNEKDVYEKVHDFIVHHPEVEGLYVSWDGPAAKVIQALSDLGRNDIAISTGDLDYADAMNMAKGGMIKMISAQSPYDQGIAIALAAANALLGHKVPSFFGIEPISVTPDNLLKSWERIFHEKPNNALVNALSENPNYIPGEN
jgi:ribose transport system substrate-binding protein